MELKHVCKFCKKCFPCGRSLGGHIRSHLIHNNNNNNNKSNSSHAQEPEFSKPGGYELRENPRKTNKASDFLNSSPSSWSTESETELESNPIPTSFKRNLPRRSSSFIACNNNSSHSSVSEVVELEPDQEDVGIAMCLIMLSRDVGKWGEFCDDISLLHANNTKKRSKREQTQGRNSVFCGTNYKKSKILEFAASGHLQNGSKCKQSQVYANGFSLNDEFNKPTKFKRKISIVNNNKMKGIEVYEDGNNDDEFGFGEAEMSSEILRNYSKRNKFECTTCNKVFHSYQALGGHRASHKKQAGVKNFAISKPNEIDITNVEDHVSRPHDNDQQLLVVADNGVGSSSPGLSSKKVAHKHECPFCFRVFPSGQALGGHKRSHLLAANDTLNNNANDNNVIISIEKSSSPEARDLLDLNLPPVPAEEETTTIPTASSSNSLVGLIKPYLWVESLISN